MKIFTAEQIRAWDAFTIAQEPIASIELMERAANALVNAECGVRNPPRPSLAGRERGGWVIWAGTGNNGGDGVAMARRLRMMQQEVTLVICDFGSRHSPDFTEQLRRLPGHGNPEVIWLKPGDPWPIPPADWLVVDALFGSGLNRPPEGEWARAISFLNQLPNPRLSVDIPSGMFADKSSPGPCIRADYTYTFQSPKLAFLLPENAEFVGKWEVLDIGLHPEYGAYTFTPNHYTTADLIREMPHGRPKFGHKGTFGHALLLAGSRGKSGAAVLAARATLRAGAGLLTVHAPQCSELILQSAVPEAMYSPDAHAEIWTQVPELHRYQAIGVGCGIGTAPETAAALRDLLAQVACPLVLDADALNLLAQNPEYWALVPPGTILTPHPKEFERLFGTSDNDFERLERLRQAAETHQVCIVLKGAHSACATPSGTVFFNSSGNPGMATAGSGDVLTGVLTGLLAQGYSPEESMVLGVYLHGRAGDLAAAANSMSALMASDLTEWLGKAFLEVE
ncbi:MAG: NAD(P)H-hydrate dehydratase [Chitinophagales bacterium]|nr:NAD(P)H-hydrate dehydratase [Chitinophagales bacterium]